MALLGTPAIVECRAENGLGDDGLVLTMGNISCTVTDSVTIMCGRNTLTGLLNGNVMTALLNISSVVCSDAGTFACLAVSDKTSKAIMTLIVSSKFNLQKHKKEQLFNMFAREWSSLTTSNVKRL